jgi:hypothetical protein
MKDLIAEVRAKLAGWTQELIPGNLEELIGRLYDTDNRQRNRLDQAPARNYQEARIDRVRFVQTSSGRKPRRWGG